MERPDGNRLQADTIDSRENTSESVMTTTRMVDFSIGLALKREDELLVKQAFSNMKDHDQSLNQSLSYIRSTPLILDVELKKLNTNRDAKVQLAIWKSGAYRKMLWHQWDTTMPMSGVTVDGSTWELFLFFVRDSRLVSILLLRSPEHVYTMSDHGFKVMMGPLEMGSTKTVKGTFEIASKLYILMKWGLSEYKSWFKRHILKWCKHKADGTLAEDAGLKSLQL